MKKKTIKKMAREISKEIKKIRNLKPVKVQNVVIKCPECSSQGKTGTLDVLSEHEKKRLLELQGKDNYPDIIFGCDECSYWCDAKELGSTEQ